MEAAGIIALVRATTSTSFQARTLCLDWMNAPRDIFHLRDELEVCRAFFESTQAGIVESWVPGESVGEQDLSKVGNEQKKVLKALISKGAQIVQELGEILAKLIREPVESASGGEMSENQIAKGCRARISLTKKILWLRRLEDVTRLRKMLRQTTQNIALCLTIMNVHITAVTAHDAEGNLRTIVDESQSSIIAQMTETLESSRQEIEASVERSMVALERSIHSHIDDRLAASCRLEENLIQRSDNHGLKFASTPKTPASLSLLPTGNRLQIPLTNGLRCQCKCHWTTQGSVTRWELSWLQHILGTLGISYTWFSFTSTKDSDNGRRCPTCKGHHQQCCRNSYSRLLIQYHFPNWLARAILSIYFFQFDSPELLIRVHRKICANGFPYSQNVISIVKANDSRALKLILSSYPSTAHDLEAKTLNSALIVAVSFPSPSTVELLLQAGADALLVNAYGASAASVALMTSLATRQTPGSPIHKVAAMMPIPDFLEKEDFTDLHRVVIGWLPLDLQTALVKPAFRSHIGKTTASGLTALHLAARFCPTGKEVQLLLDAGEDPNAAAHGSDGDTPLFWACLGGNKAGLQALLEAGASPESSHSPDSAIGNLFDQTVWSPRNTACADIYSFLFQPPFGSGINISNMYGTTLVMLAVVHFRLERLRYLVMRGASLNMADSYGQTALHYTVAYGFHDGMRLLLGMDSEIGRVGGVEERCRHISKHRGWGILHWIAYYGDVESMGIFKRVKMVGLPDPNMFRDVEGKTALDIFNERVGFEGGTGIAPGCHSDGNSSHGGGHEVNELFQAWKDLLGSVNTNVNQVRGGDGAGDTEEHERDERGAGDDGNSHGEFFDAVEA